MGTFKFKNYYSSQPSFKASNRGVSRLQFNREEFGSFKLKSGFDPLLLGRITESFREYSTKNNKNNFDWSIFNKLDVDGGWVATPSSQMSPGHLITEERDLGKFKDDSLEFVVGQVRTKDESKEIMDYVNNLPKLTNKINKNILGQLIVYKEEIGNKEEIEDSINQFNDKFKKLIIYLIISKNYLPKKVITEIDKIFEVMRNVGIEENFIKEVIFYLDNCPITKVDYRKLIGKDKNIVYSDTYNEEDIIKDTEMWDKYYTLYYDLINLARKRNAKINTRCWNLISISLRSSDIFNIPELNQMREENINKIKGQFKNIANTPQFNYPQTRKWIGVPLSNRPKTEWSNDKYQREFNRILKDAFEELKNKQIIWLTDKKSALVEDLSNITNLINEYTDDINNHLMNMFYIGRMGESYTKNRKLLRKIKILNDKRMLEFTQNKFNRDINTLILKLNEINSMDMLDARVDKWHLNEKGGPTFVIDSILKSNLNLEDKQMTIEKAVFEYDFNYINKHIDDPANKMKIYNREFINMEKNYDELVDSYTQYRALKLKKIFKPSKLKDLKKGNDQTEYDKLFRPGYKWVWDTSEDKIDILKYDDDKEVEIIEKGIIRIKDEDSYGEVLEAIIILMLIYMGKDRVLPFILKEVLRQLLDNIEGVNKTTLIFNLSNQFIKSFKISEKFEVNKSIENICSIDKLKYMINDLNDSDKVKIGDTLFSLLERNSKIISESLIRKKINYTELKVLINPEYLKNIIISNVQMSQLPMITPPRVIENEKGYYFPYLFTNIINLDECKVIKGKYDQKFDTEPSEILNKSIDYLNNIRFRINNEMLNFVLEEWELDNSVLFKGYNKFKDILAEDTAEVKKEKMTHNSIYHLYYNTLSIAILYRNHSFYLPVFCDYRGRIYTLSNYLSYQGNDLARSLFLFDKEDVINDTGRECLDIYLSNLAGYDKLSWNKRLEKVDEVINKLNEAIKDLPNRDKFIDLVKDLSEPFQFLSIGFAKLNLLCNEEQGKKNIIISNPILFDASCSGIQHISALTLDKNLGKFCNIYTTKDNPENELPEDFYTYALKLIQQKLNESKNENLKNIKLSRKIIKKSVMTIPYNISLSGVGEHMEEHFPKKKGFLKYYSYFVSASETINNTPIHLSPKEFGELTSLVYKVLNQDIPSLKALTTYFKDLIKVLNKIDEPIVWNTPSGLKIKYQQIKYESKVVSNKLNISKRNKPITISIPTDKIDKIKMERAFMPNFIHSLDASNVHLLLYSLINNPIPTYTIHDCFASTPNNLLLLERRVKDAFIDIYFKEEGYLAKTHEYIINQISNIYEIHKENGKMYINKERKILEARINPQIRVNENDLIEIPTLPEAFKSNELNDFIKGLLKSKYFIG